METVQIATYAQLTDAISVYNEYVMHDYDYKLSGEFDYTSSDTSVILNDSQYFAWKYAYDPDDLYHDYDTLTILSSDYLWKARYKQYLDVGTILQTKNYVLFKHELSTYEEYGEEIETTAYTAVNCRRGMFHVTPEELVVMLPDLTADYSFKCVVSTVIPDAIYIEGSNVFGDGEFTVSSFNDTTHSVSRLENRFTTPADVSAICEIYLGSVNEALEAII